MEFVWQALNVLGFIVMVAIAVSGIVVIGIMSYLVGNVVTTGILKG